MRKNAIVKEASIKGSLEVPIRGVLIKENLGRYQLEVQIIPSSASSSFEGYIEGKAPWWLNPKRKIKAAIKDGKALSGIITAKSLEFDEYKYEDYDEKGEKARNQILDLTNQLNCSHIEGCTTSVESSPTGEGSDVLRKEKKSCSQMKSLIEDFGEGWKIRKEGWREIKQIQEAAAMVSEYLNLTGISFGKGKALLYEGTVAPERIERILKLNERLKTKTNYTKILAITTESLSVAQGALMTLGCQCIECIGCGGCVGDPCLLVRPFIFALNIGLRLTTIAMPVVAQQVQKEIDKQIIEREDLNKSLEKITEGLELAKQEIFTCQGVTKKGEFKQLFSALEFLSYKNELEKRGYKVEIENSWPEINPENDPFTFYCVTGPLIEGISDTQDPNNLKNLDLYCDQSTESAVGEAIEKIELVVKAGQKNILEEKKKEIENSQKIVNEIRRNDEELEKDEGRQGGEDDLKKLEEKLKNFSSKDLAEMTNNLAEKYAKQFIENVFGSGEAKEVKDFFVNGAEKMNNGEFKDLFNKYLSSMMDEKLKDFSNAFLGSIPDENLKKILINCFDSFSEENLKNFWEDSFKNFTDEQKRVFFAKYLKDVDEEKLKDLYDYFTLNLSEIEKKQMLKEMLEGSSEKAINEVTKQLKTQVLEGVAPEKLDLKKVISNIPSQQLDKILKDTKTILEQEKALKRVMMNVSSEIFESAISKIPEGKIKEFTKYFYEGISEDDIKEFVLDNILDADPTFFQKFTQNLPETTMKDLIVEKGLKAFSDSEAKEIFLLLHQFPDKDPRKVLNTLILNYVPENKLSEVINTLKETEAIVDEVLNEASSAFNFKESNKIFKIKDTIDKISSYTQKVEETVNDILNKISLPFKKLVSFTQEVFDQIPNLSLKELLEDTVKELDQGQPLTALKNFLNSLPPKELKNLTKKILNEVSPQHLREVFQKNILDKLSTEESADILKEANQTLSLEESKELLNKTSSREKISENCIRPYLPEKEQLKLKKNFDQEFKDSLQRIQSKEIIECAIDYFSETELKSALKEVISKISEENLVPILSKSHSVQENINTFVEKLSQPALQNIINKLPEKELKNFSSKLLENLPRNLLEKSLQKALSSFENSINNLFSKFSEKVENNFTKKLLENFPTQKLTDYFNRTISQLSTKYLGPLLQKYGGLFGKLRSFLSGGGGLKQNVKTLMKYPRGYLTACSRCCAGDCPVCAGGTVGPEGCTPTPVVKKVDDITRNINTILDSKEKVDKAIEDEKGLIEKIKQEIWPEIDQTTKILSTPQCITKELGKEGYLVKCEDALRYGWVGRCDHKQNFVCCKRK